MYTYTSHMPNCVPELPVCTQHHATDLPFLRNLLSSSFLSFPEHFMSLSISDRLMHGAGPTQPIVATRMHAPSLVDQRYSGRATYTYIYIQVQYNSRQPVHEITVYTIALLALVQARRRLSSRGPVFWILSAFVAPNMRARRYVHTYRTYRERRDVPSGFWSSRPRCRSSSARLGRSRWVRATANYGRLDRRGGGGEARLMLRSGYRADGSGVEVGSLIHERYVLHAKSG